MDVAGYPARGEMIRVILADDQAVVRGGLRMIPESQEAIAVVGEAADGREALRLVPTLDPDVVLMDIRMPLLDGIEATRRLCDMGARARVLMLTTYGLDEYVYEALKAGAAGFLLKTESPQRLIEAVQVVAAGEALLAPEITRRLIARFVSGARPNTAPPALDELTDRERQVLALITRGLSNAEIGTALSVTPGTVKTHVARVLSKLDLRDRVQAVVFAYECGLIQPGQAADASTWTT
jgi:DNA-binding NarL/FixJ family response regulator